MSSKLGVKMHSYEFLDFVVFVGRSLIIRYRGQNIGHKVCISMSPRTLANKR